jgi:peptidoglycan/xylan/chitin deacetylase (PgdA/CDA1 family)
VAALAYHAVTDRWPHPLAITPARFRDQIERLAARGLHGRPLSELVRADRGSIGITFDDGFASVATVAKPILDEVGWRATVFVVTDAVGSEAPMRWLGGATERYDAERLPLDWKTLDELAVAGWEIGSHGRTHRLLSGLPEDELEHELAGSRAALLQRGYAATSISYPWGELDDRVVAAARRAGYTVGSGLAGRFHRGDAMRIPRVAVDGGDGSARFALKTSPWFDLARSTLLWTWTERVRRPGRPLGV